MKASSPATSHETGTSSAGMPPVPPAASGSGARRVQRMTPSSSGSPDATPSVNGSPESSGIGWWCWSWSRRARRRRARGRSRGLCRRPGGRCRTAAVPAGGEDPAGEQRAAAGQEAPPADRVHHAILARAGRAAVAARRRPAATYRFDVDSVGRASATGSVTGTRRFRRDLVAVRRRRIDGESTASRQLDDFVGVTVPVGHPPRRSR